MTTHEDAWGTDLELIAEVARAHLLAKLLEARDLDAKLVANDCTHDVMKP